MGNACLGPVPKPVNVLDAQLAKMSLADAMIQYREEFMKFLQQEVSTDYLLCLEAIQKFKATPSSAHGYKILEHFIKPPPDSGRDPTIFCISRTVDAIEGHLKANEVEEDLFDDVIEEILDVLEMDLLPRFVRQQLRPTGA